MTPAWGNDCRPGPDLEMESAGQNSHVIFLAYFGYTCIMYLLCILLVRLHIPRHFYNIWYNLLPQYHTHARWRSMFRFFLRESDSVGRIGASVLSYHMYLKSSTFSWIILSMSFCDMMIKMHSLIYFVRYYAVFQAM